MRFIKTFAWVKLISKAEHYVMQKHASLIISFHLLYKQLNKAKILSLNGVALHSTTMYGPLERNSKTLRPKNIYKHLKICCRMESCSTFLTTCIKIKNAKDNYNRMKWLNRWLYNYNVELLYFLDNVYKKDAKVRHIGRPRAITMEWGGLTSGSNDLSADKEINLRKMQFLKFYDDVPTSQNTWEVSHTTHMKRKVEWSEIIPLAYNFKSFFCCIR